ncbi:hypothetical protein [Streptomyces rubiginosohelvolus]|uniref:hypothetical protein n=1 Tax=Streptomyces rubiginosohelvolus TaxID=67362 RepID=UPI00371338A9
MTHSPLQSAEDRRRARQVVPAAATALLSTVLFIVAKEHHTLIEGAGWALGSDTTHALSDIHAIAHWSLMALLLYSLVHRHQNLYVRGSLALMLSSALTFSIHAGMERQFVPDSSLATDYMTTPSVYAGWYVLMALVLHSVPSTSRVRTGALASAALVVVLTALTADNSVIGGLMAGGLPLLSWHITKLLLGRNRVQDTARPALLGSSAGRGA